MLLRLNECDLSSCLLEVFDLVAGTADGLHNHIQHLMVMPPIVTFIKCFGTLDVVSFSPPELRPSDLSVYSLSPSSPHPLLPQYHHLSCPFLLNSWFHLDQILALLAFDVAR